MKNGCRIIAFLFLSFLLVVNTSGCRTQKENNLKGPNDKFIKGEFNEALFSFGELVKKDSGNTVARLRLATAKVCLSSDAGEFLKEISWIGKKDSRVKRIFDTKKFGAKNGFAIKNNNSIRAHISERYNDIAAMSDEIGLLTEAIENNFDREELYLGRGLWYYLISDLSSAIKDFSKAIKLNSNFSEAYRMRGTCYFESPDYNLPLERMRSFCNAWFDFNHAVHINPKDKEALFLLALSYLSLNQTSEAEIIMKKYGNLDPQNSRIRFLQNGIKAQFLRANTKQLPGNESN